MAWQFIERDGELIGGLPLKSCRLFTLDDSNIVSAGRYVGLKHYRTDQVSLQLGNQRSREIQGLCRARIIRLVCVGGARELDSGGRLRPGSSGDVHGGHATGKLGQLNRLGILWAITIREGL